MARGRDATGQLTAADHSYQSDEAYAYDANGNRTNAGYATGDDNRLLADGVHTYEYDAEGNRTKKTVVATGAYEEYAWDHRNRLVAVASRTSAGARSWAVEYDYDASARLVGRRQDADGDGVFESAERFAYDGTQAVLVFDDSGSLKSRLLYGPAVDQVFAEEDGAGGVLWMLADHLGTVRDVAEYDAGTGVVLVWLIVGRWGS